jgi:hypothetical protein
LTIVTEYPAQTDFPRFAAYYSPGGGIFAHDVCPELITALKTESRRTQSRKIAMQNQSLLLRWQSCRRGPFSLDEWFESEF